MVVVQDFEKRQSEVRRAFDLKVVKSHPLDWLSKPRWLKPGDLGTAFCQKSGRDFAGRWMDAGRVIGQDTRGCLDAAGSRSGEYPTQISHSDCTVRAQRRCTAQSKEDGSIAQMMRH